MCIYMDMMFLLMFLHVKHVEVKEESKEEDAEWKWKWTK